MCPGISPLEAGPDSLAGGTWPPGGTAVVERHVWWGLETEDSSWVWEIWSQGKQPVL